MRAYIFKLFLIFVTTNTLYSQFSWQNCGFNYGGQVYALTITSNNYYFAGHSTGIYRSTDNCVNWVKVYEPSGSSTIISLAYNLTNNYLYAGRETYSGQYGGIFRSTNSGASGSWVQVGLANKKILDLLVLPNGYVIAASNTDYPNGGVFRSTDNGINWAISLGAQYHSFCLAKDQNNYIYVGTDDPGPEGYPTIMRSTDMGVTWSTFYQFIGYSTYVRGICVLYNGYIFAHFSDKLFRSTNNGANFTQVLNNVNHYDILHFAYNTANNVFIASFGNGVYGSTDAGSNWSLYNSGLSNTNVISIVYNMTNYLLVGAVSSVFKTDVMVSTLNENINLPLRFTLFQNYPNPFNPTTKIGFDIPKQSEVNVKIYDVLGAEITTLVNEKLNAGTYSTDWDASNYPSGIYFYVLESDGFIDSKKMVLIK